MVFPGRVSVWVMVKVAVTGFPVTTLPPNPPINPPNSNMPAIGPPGPLPPNPPGGGPCAFTTRAAPANSIAPIPAPSMTFLTDYPPRNVSPKPVFGPCPRPHTTVTEKLLDQLHPARPTIFPDQNIRQNQVFIRRLGYRVAELSERGSRQLDAHDHSRIVRGNRPGVRYRHKIGGHVGFVRG